MTALLRHRAGRTAAALGLAALAVTAAGATAAATTTPTDSTPTDSTPADGTAPAASGGLDCAAIAGSVEPPADLSIFLGLVEESQGVFTTSMPAAGTVLIPADSAFESMPENVLSMITDDPQLVDALVDFHYLPGDSLMIDDLVAAGTVATGVEGADVVFGDEDGSVTVTAGDAAATVLCSDITTGAIAVHVIDTVLQPPVTVGGVPGSSVPGSSVPGNSVPGNSVPGNSVPGNSVPGNSVPGGSVPSFDADGQAVATSWQTVTDSSSDVDDVVALIENGEDVRATAEAYPEAADVVGGITSEVRSVTISGEQAAITYVLFFDGVEQAYGELDGELTFVDGTWVVPQDVYCEFQSMARTPTPCVAAAGLAGRH